MPPGQGRPAGRAGSYHTRLHRRVRNGNDAQWRGQGWTDGAPAGGRQRWPLVRPRSCCVPLAPPLRYPYAPYARSSCFPCCLP